MRTMRLPFEANSPAWIKPWVELVRAKLDLAGIARNDYVASISETGKMDETVLLEAIAGMSEGVCEIYRHPALPGDGPLTPAMNATVSWVILTYRLPCSGEPIREAKVNVRQPPRS